MGRMLAGIIGDALAQGSGFAPVYTPAMRQREALSQQEAQWSRRRQAENEDWRNRQQWERDNPVPAPIQRDAAAWMGMTPEQRQAVQEMTKAREGDPIVNTTLPNGQFWSGPRSGLAAALSGQASPVPVAPVGKLRPLGGPTPPASGAFRP